jgi:hypothetical protein
MQAQNAMSCYDWPMSIGNTYLYFCLYTAIMKLGDTLPVRVKSGILKYYQE